MPHSNRNSSPVGLHHLSPNCDTEYPIYRSYASVVSCNKIHHGYKLAEVGTKKEDDLFHLLNLVCLKYTGHYLPADGETANIHKFILCDGKKLCSTPLRNPRSIMSYATDNSLAHQVKRIMVCDKIKKMREYQDYLPDLTKYLMDKFPDSIEGVKIHIGRVGGYCRESVDYHLTSDCRTHHRLHAWIEGKFKEIAYDLLMGEIDEPELINTIRKFAKRNDYFADLTLTEKRMSYVMTTPYSASRLKRHLCWGSLRMKAQDLSKLGSGYTPESLADLLMSSRMDYRYENQKIDKGVGNGFEITKANKIRKGKEYQVFCALMSNWGLGFKLGCPDENDADNIVRKLRDNTDWGYNRSVIDDAWRRTLGNVCYWDIHDILENGQLKPEMRKRFWRAYKMEGESLGSDYFIKMATGKTNDIDVEGKLVSMFC
jgi:hypothetical protein